MHVSNTCAVESEKQRCEQLKSISENAYKMHAVETQEERSQRLANMSERAHDIQSMESEEYRRVRLKQMHENAQSRRRKISQDIFYEIKTFADVAVCPMCHKLLFDKQRHKLNTTNSRVHPHLPSELQKNGIIISYKMCYGNLNKGKIPSQAYWNKMYGLSVPACI